MRVGSDQHLAVAVCTEDTARSLEFCFEFDVIVNFAVEYQPIPAVLVCHRLVPSFAQIDDRQPAMSKRQWPALGVEHLPSLTVWAAMADNVDVGFVWNESEGCKDAAQRLRPRSLPTLAKQKQISCFH